MNIYFYLLFINFYLAFSGFLLEGLSKETISEIDAITHENKDHDMKEYIINKSRIDSEKKLITLENLINSNLEKLQNNSDFNEEEIKEDLKIFNKIINENIRDEILECEDTIDDNISFLGHMINNKI
jgi:hypothetical protein